MPTVRKTLISIAMAVSVASPMLASCAHAATNNGGFWKSSANHAITCDSMFTMFDTDVDQADKADKAGNKKALKSALKNATSDLHMAQAAGCDWAA